MHMKKSWFYYKGVRKYVFLTIGLLIVLQLLTIYLPMLLKDIATYINLNDLSDGEKIKQVVLSGLLVLGVIILIFVINTVAEYFGSLATAHFSKVIRSELYEKVQNTSTESVTEIGSGRLLPMIMNDTDWLRKIQKNYMLFIVYFPIVILGSIILLFNLNPFYAYFALCSIPIVIVFFILCSRKVNKILQKSIPAFDEIHFNVKEGIVGAKEVRIFNKAKEREKEYEKLSLFQRQQTTTVSGVTFLSESFNSVLFTIITVAIILYGAYTMTDVTELIILNTAIQYVKMIWEGSHYIFKLFVDYIPRVAIAKRRIGEIYDLVPEPKGEGIKTEPMAAKRALEFNGVSYKYFNMQQGLSNVNMKIGHDSRVALVGVGGIGSGRHVVYQMLLQYLKPASGKILLSGVNINSIEPIFFRKNILSLCPQEAVLVQGTIRSNLTLLNQTATDEQILKIFDEIGASDFVAKFENFLDYQIYDNTHFNDATKNLLNVVRSLLKPASIYVFDQCFEHIRSDYITKVLAKLKREKRTCLFISYKPQIWKACNQIYLMKSGKIVGSGAHEELLAKNADYRELNSVAAGQIFSDEKVVEKTVSTDAPVAFAGTGGESV